MSIYFVDTDAAARTFSISYRFRLQLVVIFVARLVLWLFDLSSISPPRTPYKVGVRVSLGTLGIGKTHYPTKTTVSRGG